VRLGVERAQGGREGGDNRLAGDVPVLEPIESHKAITAALQVHVTDKRPCKPGLYQPPHSKMRSSKTCP